MAMSYYSVKVQREISKGKANGAKARGDQALTPRVLPWWSHSGGASAPVKKVGTRGALGDSAARASTGADHECLACTQIPEYPEESRCSA